MPQGPSQLFLLADHIKLSLLERQRAQALQLDSRSQDAEITRSLQSLDAAISALDEEQQESHDLQRQYQELYRQFHGSAAIASAPLKPNDPSLAGDFSKAQTARARDAANASTTLKKSVRFTDAQEDANRIALLPYRDDPDDAPDHTNLDNQQIHQYHSEVIRRQDQDLDALSASVGRTRELSIRIGDELDDQAYILTDIDENVDRHQSQLDRAKSRLGHVARTAKDNIGMSVIVVLILLLVLLLIIL